MDRQQAIEFINRQDPTYLQKAKKTGYVCPVCGNGGGKDGTGITKDPNDREHPHYKCFNGACGLYADNLELIKEYYQLPDFNEAIKKGCELYGIAVDRPADYKPELTITPADKEIETAEIKTDFAEDLEKWHKAIQAEGNAGLLYLQGRGLSIETINRFKIGYCENWKHPKAPNAPASPRVIIPTSRYSYLARDIRSEIPEPAKKYSKSKAGKVRIFNLKAVENTEKPIFIVEGEIDAISIIEAGGQAVALGSTAYTQLFLDGIKGTRITQPLIIALDNDTAGNRASDILENAFKQRGIYSYRINPCGAYKDANEALTASKDFFIRDIQEITEDPAKWEYKKNNAENYIAKFLDDIDDNINTPAVPTGFKILDTMLDGGLFEGLYVLGAISSLGKTSFILQIADQIAQGGNDVLYISLEMARYELMAKSISRHTMLSVLENGGNISDAKTVRGITNGAKWKYYTRAEHELISKAINDYSKYVGHLYIHEGIGTVGVEQIAELTQRHIDITGNRPVIVIDYLQILAPYDMRGTDKQNTDRAVLELKRLSRQHKIPVIAISSFNRDNYKAEVSMQAFKESGAIEYGSDVLFGLQFKGAGEKGFDNEAVNEAFSKDPREIELKVLKHRNGDRPKGAFLYEYYPKFNYFKEVSHGGERTPKQVKSRGAKTWDQLEVLMNE